jgi:hypothetical protein
LISPFSKNQRRLADSADFIAPGHVIFQTQAAEIQPDSNAVAMQRQRFPHELSLAHLF